MEKDSKELRALILAAQAGDEQAFEQILRLIEVPVYRLAFSMLRHKEDAEDVSQEVLIKLWRTLPDYRFECPLLLYVLKMTRNAALDLERKRSRRRENEVSLTVENDDGERVDRELADTSEDNDPAKRLTRAERIAEVRRAIEALPPDQREIIILKDIQGLSYAQIADLLSIEEGTVGSRISRARKNLEKILRNGKIF